MNYCLVKANYYLTSLDREVAAVSEAMLSFTDAGGLQCYCAYLFLLDISAPLRESELLLTSMINPYKNMLIPH